MKIQSTRFGEIEIDDSSVIHFKNGMIGFPECHNFAIIRPEEEQVFHWLVSCDNPFIAFPLVDLRLHFPHLAVIVRDDDAKALGISAKNPSKFCRDLPTWGVVTLTNDLTQMTVNLKAPVVIMGQFGAQCIQKDPTLRIREPLFEILAKYHNTSKSSSESA